MNAIRAGLEGLQARLVGTAALTALLASDAGAGAVPAIYRGWPALELLEENADFFPMLTWEAPDDDLLAPGGSDDASIELTIDLWVWPDGAAGGDERLEEIDEQLIAALAGASWRHEGYRISAVLGPARNDPTRRDDYPIRRTRRGSLVVSR